MNLQTVLFLNKLIRNSKKGYCSKKAEKSHNSSFSITVNEYLHAPCNSKKLTRPPPPAPAVVADKLVAETETRTSDLNVQLLSNNIYKQIFGNDLGTEATTDTVSRVKGELQKFGLWKDVELAPDVEFKLPKLQGDNIEQHFWNIGNEQSQAYKKLIVEFANKAVPPPPSEWALKEGWTKYCDGATPESVPYPDEGCLIFDVEVCCKLGHAPTMATAVSPTAWYGWVSPSLLLTGEPVPFQRYTPDLFIPLEGKKSDRKCARVVVGHNVSYDRARVREQYSLERSALRFVDTMSMHICIGGVTSFQRSMLKSKTAVEDEGWREYSSLNSLKEVYKLYCKEELSKEPRNLFVDGSLSEIRDEFQDLMKYCAGDVMATFKILQKMVPIFFDRFPHPVTFAGMLEMGTAFLPVNGNWEKYLSDSQQTFEDLEKESKFLLERKCDNACYLYHNEEYKNDLWMWDEDWSTQELKMTKKKVSTPVAEKEITVDEEAENVELEEKFRHIFEGAARLPVKRPHLPGYPLWHRKLCEKPLSEDWVPGPQLISSSVKITPKVLNLTWEGYPLHYTREYGWGILVADLNADVTDTKVPFSKLKELTMKLERTRRGDHSGSLIIDRFQDKVDDSISKEDYWRNRKKGETAKSNQSFCDYKVEDCCYFLKLPHKDGAENNVGNPLAKDFIKNFSTSVLAGADAVASKVLEIGTMLSYWRNNCERICRQLVVWRNQNEGVILPQVVVSGTLTRRAMEPTWMTASNAQAGRIGSELRSMVQAPPGYHIVGADVDSQELWIASVIGDAAFAGMHACTPFGWMTLSGSKASGTDMHSVTAKATGISRDHAKVINYARIYGAGVRFAQRLLKQFNPKMSDSEAKDKANKMFLLTKGRKVYRLKEKFLDQVPEDANVAYSSYNASRMAKVLGKPINEVFERPTWEGGSESAMFNRLEEVACSIQPRTPFLSARLSRALEPRFPDDDSYLTTRVNWVVQSGAVDFLHLMLVSLRWLSQGKMRFCLSFHDEVRYLVPSHLRYEAALALHITNLLTRCFCARRLGLHDLPQSVAFFASVEVDTVLRKEAKDDCITPSNPYGLEKGHGIPPGESLNIYETLKKTNGELKNLQKLSYVKSYKKKTCLPGTGGPPSATARTNGSPSDL